MDFEYPWRFSGRRSAVMATGGMVATSQPLAARAGLRILEEGGTAADAAIATAATLAVVEPHMTGVGGDAFALTHFDGEVTALNASGGAPAAADLDDYRERTDARTDDGEPAVPLSGGLPVTVPGALGGWQRLLDRYGTMSLAEVLEPAIGYASDGFPVSECVAGQWADAAERLRAVDPDGGPFLPGGSPPASGDRFRNPTLAETFELVAAEGPGVLYGGEVGAAVVEAVRAAGGTLALSDLADYEAEWTEPVSTTYRGVEVLEHPPNGQGVVALEALNVTEAFDLPPDPADPTRLHTLVEAVKLGFADGHAYVTDPARVDVPVERMLEKAYAAERAAEIGEMAGSYAPRAGPVGSDTVYLTVVDGDGNAVSFINSIFSGFGSGVVVRGFALQNRGRSFSLDPDHANALAPGKRPYHTIIPAMLREDGAFRASFGVMGGHMQPQGHLQVVAAMVDSALNPQAALDVPRFRWQEGNRVVLETNRLPASTVAALRERGHEVVEDDWAGARSDPFGGGQVVYRAADGTLVGGSDPRRDGLAVGY